MPFIGVNQSGDLQETLEVVREHLLNMERVEVRVVDFGEGGQGHDPLEYEVYVWRKEEFDRDKLHFLQGQIDCGELEGINVFDVESEDSYAKPATLHGVLDKLYFSNQRRVRLTIQVLESKEDMVKPEEKGAT